MQRKQNKNTSKTDSNEQLQVFPPKFSLFFVGKEYKVVKHQYYDPDTINVVIPIEGKEVTFPIRALGYDSIEKRQKKKESEHLTQEDRDLLLQKYKESEVLIAKLIKDKPLRIKCDTLDLYGRILADIYVQDENDNELHVNNVMIQSKLVFPYLGKKKLTLDQQVAFFKSQ